MVETIWAANQKSLKFKSSPEMGKIWFDEFFENTSHQSPRISSSERRLSINKIVEETNTDETDSHKKIREIDFTENKLNTIQASIEGLKVAQQNIQKNFLKLQENLYEMQEQRKYDLVELKNMLQTHDTNL